MRDFYAENNYEILRSEETFEDLITLANFWNDVANHNEKFSPRVLKRLYVLQYSPYSVWFNVVSLYFMINRELDEEKFCAFLDKVTAMILMNAVMDYGKNNIRRPFVLEFKDIFHGKPLEFDKQFKLDLPTKKFFISATARRRALLILNCAGLLKLATTSPKRTLSSATKKFLKHSLSICAGMIYYFSL